jgi:hypothetical protein
MCKIKKQLLLNKKQLCIFIKAAWEADLKTLFNETLTGIALQR